MVSLREPEIGKLLVHPLLNGHAKLYIGRDPIRGIVIDNCGENLKVTLSREGDHVEIVQINEKAVDLNDCLQWMGSLEEHQDDDLSNG